MKKILLIIFLLGFFTAYGQDTIKVVVTKDVPIYKKYFGNELIEKIKKGDTLSLLSYQYISSAFYVINPIQNGYVFDWHLADIPNIESIKEQLKDIPIPRNPRREFIEDYNRRPTNRTSSTKSDMDRYKELYGRPDDTSSFSSGDYESITYTWYCARGRYRQIDFVKKNGKYVKDSEYTSDCIRTY